MSPGWVWQRRHSVNHWDGIAWDISMGSMALIDPAGLARATPRAWLEQGKRIRVTGAPTFFGPVGFEIVSDVDRGKLLATIDMPSARPSEAVMLRLRHPQAAPIKGVLVDGKPWRDFDPQRELIRLEGIKGRVVVEASY